MPRLARIRLYPIKSCRGYDVPAADLDEMGLAGDRRFQVISPVGKPFTQRTHAKLARVDAHLHADSLEINCAGLGACVVPLSRTVPTRTITTEVWSTGGLQADPTLPAADEFFSELLDERARLIQTGTAFSRPVKRHPNQRVGFADAFPLLVISEASLQDLNDRLVERGTECLEMERFRPNLVLTECEAYAEDQWSGLEIEGLKFAAAGPCERCIMTTIDPLTGEKTGPEPLATLAGYRRDPGGNGVIFGQNLVHQSNRGSLKVGASVMPLS